MSDSEWPGEGYVKTIIYTTLTLPSPIKGEGKKLSRCVYYIRLVEFLVMQSFS